MRLSMWTLLLACSAGLFPAAAQTDDIVFLSEPVPLWNAIGPPGGLGNECKLTPKDNMMVTTGSDGIVVAYNPVSGKEVWRYAAQTVTGNPLFCQSGISFGSSDALGNFFVYAVTEGFAVVDPSFCVVYAVNDQGQLLWRSQALEGACSGTPLVSSDGKYVFLTHNLVSSGRFTILLAEADGAELFSELNTNQPFSPPGIYHEPNEGYFEGGQGNRNDVVIWAHSPKPEEEGVGFGAWYAFQLPLLFNGDPDRLSVATLGEVTWQATTAPVIANRGYSLYYAISRSQFRSWNGAFGDRSNQFGRGATNGANYPRGQPVWQSVYTSLELSSDEEAPNAYGGTAGTVFVGLDSELNEMWSISTIFPVRSEARISPDDSVVYFVEQNGDVQAVDALTGEKRWERSLGRTPIMSNFCQKSDGDSLFFVDQAGVVHAWKVAQTPTKDPTASPTASLSSLPTSIPTAPTSVPTGKPSVATTLSPSNAETASPSTPPTTTMPTTVPTTLAPTTAAPTIGEQTGGPTVTTSSPTLTPTAKPSATTTPPPTTGTRLVPPTSGAGPRMLLVWLLAAVIYGTIVMI